MKNYAVVGFGCAGYHAAEAIRRQDAGAQIHVFETLCEPPFNPMLSTYYASGKIPREQSFVFGPLEQISRDLSLALHTGVTVEAVRGRERALLLSNSEQPSFDGIVIATGARAFAPPIPGLPDRRVFLMRTLQDAEDLRDYLDANPIKTGVVVGASMVGIKVAQLLYERAVATTVVDAAPRLFPLAAMEPLSRRMEARLREMGLDFRWNAGVEAIEPEGVRIATGELLPADVICLCIGTRANTGIVSAPDSGVAVNRGIVVDTRMRTSAEGIYAAGDCCEGNNLQSGQTQIIGLWANAGCQGRTAGTVCAGGHADYAGNIIHNITHFMGMEFVGLGDNRIQGKHLVYEKDGMYLEVVLADGKICCANLLDCGNISGVLKSLMLRQLTGESPALTPMQRAYLRGRGLPESYISQIEGEDHE